MKVTSNPNYYLTIFYLFRQKYDPFAISGGRSLRKYFDVKKKDREYRSFILTSKDSDLAGSVNYEAILRRFLRNENGSKGGNENEKEKEKKTV